MKRIVDSNGVAFYSSELIPCPHGFSTRYGGVSTLPHTVSLNLGFDRGDERDVVIENLGHFASAVGFDAKSVVVANQIHSNHIATVTESHRGEGFFRPSRENCDGLITFSSDVTLGVRTADCVPILLYAPPTASFPGAVGALHAGWRGTASGIVTKAIELLVSMGAVPSSIRAAIGPSIGSCCYRVRSDFYKSFISLAGREMTDRYVHRDPDSEDGFFADLWGVNRELLVRSGVVAEHIDVCSKCTFCNNGEFYSHRFSGGVRGSMLSVITLEKNYERR